VSKNSSEITWLREAFASLSTSARTTEGCPDPDRIWAAALGEPRPGETKRLAEHTLHCPSCAESWRLALELGGSAMRSPAATESTAFGPPARERALARSEAATGPWWFRRRSGWILAAAAALVLAAVGIRVLQRPEATDTEYYRSPEEAGIRSLVPEDRLLPREACVLKWSAGPEGARYNVRVASEDLREITSARSLAAAEYAIPASLLQDLPPRSRLLWQVELLLPDGERRISVTFVNYLE